MLLSTRIIMSYLTTSFIDGLALSRVANGTFVRWHTSLLCIFVLRQIGDTASVPPYLAHPRTMITQLFVCFPAFCQLLK